MGRILLEIIGLFFASRTVIDSKAEEYRIQRLNRYEEFNKLITENLWANDPSIGNNTVNKTGTLHDLASILGIATREEIDEIKDMIEKITEKIKGIEKE